MSSQTNDLNHVLFFRRNRIVLRMYFISFPSTLPTARTIPLLPHIRARLSYFHCDNNAIFFVIHPQLSRTYWLANTSVS